MVFSSKTVCNLEIHTVRAKLKVLANRLTHHFLNFSSNQAITSRRCGMKSPRLTDHINARNQKIQNSAKDITLRVGHRTTLHQFIRQQLTLVYNSILANVTVSYDRPQLGKVNIKSELSPHIYFDTFV